MIVSKYLWVRYPFLWWILDTGVQIYRIPNALATGSKEEILFSASKIDLHQSVHDLTNFRILFTATFLSYYLNDWGRRIRDKGEKKPEQGQHILNYSYNWQQLSVIFAFQFQVVAVPQNRRSTATIMKIVKLVTSCRGDRSYSIVDDTWACIQLQKLLIILSHGIYFNTRAIQQCFVKSMVITYSI